MSTRNVRRRMDPDPQEDICKALQHTVSRGIGFLRNKALDNEHNFFVNPSTCLNVQATIGPAADLFSAADVFVSLWISPADCDAETFRSLRPTQEIYLPEVAVFGRVVNVSPRGIEARHGHHRLRIR